MLNRKLGSKERAPQDPPLLGRAARAPWATRLASCGLGMFSRQRVCAISATILRGPRVVLAAVSDPIDVDRVRQRFQACHQGHVFEYWGHADGFPADRPPPPDQRPQRGTRRSGRGTAQGGGRPGCGARRRGDFGAGTHPAAPGQRGRASPGRGERDRAGRAPGRARGDVRGCGGPGNPSGL